MNRSSAVCASLLLAGCGAHETPGPAPAKVPPKTPAATIAPTASLSAEPTDELAECPDKPTPVAGIGAGGPWVEFFARSYDPEAGPSQGASWGFSARGLPAISKDGTRVLSYTEDPLISGDSSRERLQILRASDEKVMSAKGLRFGDLRKVEEAGEDVAQIGRAYDALARETAREIEVLNAQITAEGWSSLVACRVDIQAEETTPGCSMKNQEIHCGDWLSATYEEPRLDISVRSKKVTLKEPGWSRPPEPSHQIDVRGCIGGAYHPPSHALLLLRISYFCQIQGADWCTQPDAWHILQLPAVPGADTPLAAPRADCPAAMTGAAVKHAPPAPARATRARSVGWTWAGTSASGPARTSRSTMLAGSEEAS